MARTPLAEVEYRRMEVLRLLHEGYSKQSIAETLGAGVATIYRDAKWIEIERKAGRLRADSYLSYTPHPSVAAPAVIARVSAEPPLTERGKPAVVIPDSIGPQTAKEQTQALDRAAELWRMHVPDPLVALTAFGVDSALLAVWLKRGRKAIAEGQPECWEGRVYMQRAAAFTDSLMGHGSQAGIMERLFSLVGDGDPKVAMQAIKMLLEQGAMRNFYGRSIDVNVASALPSVPEAVDASGGSGLADALALIGAEASADASA